MPVSPAPLGGKWFNASIVKINTCGAQIRKDRYGSTVAAKMKAAREYLPALEVGKQSRAQGGRGFRRTHRLCQARTRGPLSSPFCAAADSPLIARLAATAPAHRRYGTRPAPTRPSLASLARRWRLCCLMGGRGLAAR